MGSSGQRKKRGGKKMRYSGQLQAGRDPIQHQLYKLNECPAGLQLLCFLGDSRLPWLSDRRARSSDESAERGASPAAGHSRGGGRGAMDGIRSFEGTHSFRIPSDASSIRLHPPPPSVCRTPGGVPTGAMVVPNVFGCHCFPEIRSPPFPPPLCTSLSNFRSPVTRNGMPLTHGRAAHLGARCPPPAWQTR